MNKTICIAILTLLVSSLQAKTSEITVSVFSNKKPLNGVVVTDGFSFAKTDSKGICKLNLSSEADFVYIVTPSGYTAPYDEGAPKFYIAVDKEVKSYDFNLLPMPNRDDSYTLIAIADPQTGTDAHFKRFVNESIADLSKTVSLYKSENRQIAAIALGDIAWDNLDDFSRYKKEIAKLGIPFYAVIGNHDHDLAQSDDHAAGEAYRKAFGPTYYAFDLGKSHYVVVDNIIYNGNKNYDTAIDQNQLSWIREYSKFIEPSSDVCIAMHAPVKISSEENYKLGGSEELIEIFKTQKLRFISGHTHVNSNSYVANGVFENNIATICGAWWTADFCKDGTPVGYKIYEANGKNVTSFYKSIGRDRSYQIKLYSPGTVSDQPNSVCAKIWDWDSTWSAVTWSEDGIYKGEMKLTSIEDPDYSAYLAKQRSNGKPEVKEYKSPVVANFYFVADVSPETKKVTVEVKDKFGRIYKSTISLN